MILNAVKTSLLAAVLTTVLAFSTELRKLEGDIFPVVNNFSVVQFTVSNSGVPEVELHFTKVRNCDFVKSQLYINFNGDYWTQVIYVNKTNLPATTLPVGKYETIWKVYSPETLINHRIKLRMEHKCWGETLWQTITEQELTLSFITP